MIHFFKQPISHLALPDKFTYPFHYTPHPLCVLAAEEVKEYIASREEWQEELAFGKMFGVLIVQKENKQETAKKEAVNEIGYLVNPEKPDVPINKNDAFQKVQKRRVQEKR